MSLVDNNLPLDDEIIEIVRDCLIHILARHPEGAWFTQEELYGKLEIRFTPKREGNLDNLIRQTLEEWNWHCVHIGRGTLSYVRRNFGAKPTIITLSDGHSFSTSATWPPVRPSSPETNGISSTEEVRARLINAKRRQAVNSVAFGQS